MTEEEKLVFIKLVRHLRLSIQGYKSAGPDTCPVYWDVHINEMLSVVDKLERRIDSTPPYDPIATVTDNPTILGIERKL